MNVGYVPLLRLQRELQDIPRGQAPDFNGLKRFKQYLRTVLGEDGNEVVLPPLVAANPMAKDHVTKLLDELLALDADGVASRAGDELMAELAPIPGEAKATLVLVDDWMGPWTNRAPAEFDLCIRAGSIPDQLPRWTKHFWITGVLWSSEPATARGAREAILTALYRVAYVHQHGPARTLRAMIAQEGWVMAKAGCTTPALDADDLDYTREVLTPNLDADDMRTCIECLFGDPAARALGFTPRGLSPRAGLALALADGRLKLESERVDVK